MKKLARITLITAISIAVFWTALTIWVDQPGPAHIKRYGSEVATQKVLIVYDPDPIYNLDEQLCNAFAKELNKNGIASTVATTRAANDINNKEYDALLLCANTYNWRPDRAVTNYIKKQHINGMKIIALTLGSGSTKKSKEVFDKKIIDAGGIIIDSKTLWLLRPNDEERLDEGNVEVAISITQKWAAEIAARI